jgi:hypothetical protein
LLLLRQETVMLDIYAFKEQSNRILMMEGSLECNAQQVSIAQVALHKERIALSGSIMTNWVLPISRFALTALQINNV